MIDSRGFPGNLSKERGASVYRTSDLISKIAGLHAFLQLCALPASASQFQQKVVKLVSYVSTVMICAVSNGNY